MSKKIRPVRSGERRSESATPPDAIARGRRGKPAEKGSKGPPGVQGANVGYWQSGGVTRAGAKRSKRP
jgi:hypothetical protein